MKPSSQILVNTAVLYGSLAMVYLIMEALYDMKKEKQR